MSYPIVKTVLEATSPTILRGLQSGKFVRCGGVIRHAAGQVNGGRIVAFLKDSGLFNNAVNIVTGSFNPLNTVLQAGGLALQGVQLVKLNKMDKKLDGISEQVTQGFSLLSNQVSQTFLMSSVGAAASVLNLGVSIAGFAYLAYQTHKLREALISLDQKVSEGFDNINNRLDNIAIRLEELRYYANLNQETLCEILNEVKNLRQEFFESQQADFLSALEIACTSGTLHTLEENLRIFKKVKHSMSLSLDKKRLSNSNIKEITDTGIRFRLWASACAAEGQSFIVMNKLSEATECFKNGALTSKNWTYNWSNQLLGNNGWMQYGHSYFKEAVLEDRLMRIAQASENRELLRSEYNSKKFDGAINHDAYLASLNNSKKDEDFSTKIGNAAFIDLIKEVSDRLDSKAEECIFCQSKNINFNEWEKLGINEREPILVLCTSEWED